MADVKKEIILEVRIRTSGEQLQNFGQFCARYDIKYTPINYSPVSLREVSRNVKTFAVGMWCGIIVGYLVMYATLR